MKPKPTPAPSEPAAEVGVPGSGGEQKGEGQRDNARRWFKILLLVSPLLLLGLLEAGLRLAGYGASSSFFLRTQQGGQSVLVENPRFGWMFFPPRVARSPQPLALAMPKPAGTVRIFLFGESAAMGDPEPAYGLGRQLERLLQANHPDKHVEVVNVAMTAINSHVIREIARNCEGLQGDAWVFYAGNNEVVGPFGAGTVFGGRAPGLTAVRANIALKKTRLGQLFTRMFSGSAEPAEWQGMEMFLRRQVTASDPRLKTVYSSFEQNLQESMQAGRRAGAVVVASTVAVNLKDNPPFASEHDSQLGANQAAWDKLFAAGKEAQERGEWKVALTNYQQAAQLDGAYAELAFRRGTCELALGQKAEEDFQKACDLDTLRFRADTQMNTIVREVARSQGVTCVEAAQDLAASAANQPGPDELFYDHVHLNFDGNYRLAVMFARALERELFNNAKPVSWLPRDEVAAQLAFSGFDQYRVGEEMRLRLQQPPFSSQLNFKSRDAQWESRLAALDAVPSEAKRQYDAAVGLNPWDWVLHANYARVLEAGGENQAALSQWRIVAQAMPREPEPWFQLANLAYELGAYGDAEQWFAMTLRLNPESLEAVNGLGLLRLDQGRLAEARRLFDSALRNQPRFSAARVNLASLLAREGKSEEAVAEYTKVLKDEPNNVAARINLAKLAAGQGKADEAVRLYEEAVRLRPKDAIAQYDLGNALSAQGKHAEALEHYAAAVRNRPEFADAQYNLAVELARAGRVTEASDHFAQVVRLKPDSAEGHFNYGVALAKQQRYAEAVKEFQETLRLQPGYAGAQEFLSRATQAAQRSGQGGLGP